MILNHYMNMFPENKFTEEEDKTFPRKTTLIILGALLWTVIIAIVGTVLYLISRL